ncbi:MAG: hypothetical protein AB8B91_21870 [Rubripirellula sp.]
MGSLVVEVAIVVMLLATATIALSKLARSSADLNLQADQRLALTLAAENTIERLRALPVEDLKDQTNQLAAEVAERANCQVDVTADSFQSDTEEGLHLEVTARFQANVGVTLHDWRMGTDLKNEKNADETSNDGEQEDSE